VRKHELGAAMGMSAHCSIVRAARKLLVSKSDGESSDDTEDVESDAGTWDPERVVRHLERGIAHGYQLLQRARWLCLLFDSDVVFREPTSDKTRLLRVREGRVVEARDVADDEALQGSIGCRPLRERQVALDRMGYDRLRTLTTELKRVVRDGGSAAVRVGRGRWLRGGVLDGILRWV
jgi:DNA polymerase-3 subunit epsilon